MTIVMTERESDQLSFRAPKDLLVFLPTEKRRNSAESHRDGCLLGVAPMPSEKPVFPFSRVCRIIPQVNSSLYYELRRKKLMLPLECQAILFDLDGTLVDSTPQIHRLWEWWAQRNGIDTDTIVGGLQGRKGLDTIRALAPHLQAEREQQVLEAHELILMEGLQKFPGVADLLDQLPPERWAIVTSGSLRVAQDRLDRVGLAAPAVFITGDDVANGKPSPEGYLLAARRLGVDPAQCVVVEDSPVGVQSGKAAGMRVIAVTNSHPAEELRQADAIVRGLAALQVSAGPRGLVLQDGS